MRRAIRLSTLLTAFLLACSSGSDPAPEPAPDFSLLDVNDSSDTHDTMVSPRDYEGFVAGFYFGAATWGYCRNQFGFLDQIQNDLETENPATKIRLLGVNSFDSSSANPLMIAGRDLPWLQDTVDEQAWNDWGASIDDVIICDETNTIVRTYNLIENDLTEQANTDELIAILKGLAGE